jgi:hypothetical protein
VSDNNHDHPRRTEMSNAEITHDFPDTAPDHAVKISEPPLYNGHALLPWLPPTPTDPRD